KKFILLSCVIPCIFAAATATAQMRGHRGSTAPMPMHRAPVLNSASRFQSSRGGNFHRDGRFHSFHRFNDGDFDRDDRFRRFHRFDEIIVFDNFGFPFFPFYYPPAYYPYSYGDYYSYPSDGYGEYGYQTSYGVNGSLVVQVQRRLA